jgi:hypothetical protein
MDFPGIYFKKFYFIKASKIFINKRGARNQEEAVVGGDLPDREIVKIDDIIYTTETIDAVTNDAHVAAIKVKNLKGKVLKKLALLLGIVAVFLVLLFIRDINPIRNLSNLNSTFNATANGDMVNYTTISNF